MQASHSFWEIVRHSAISIAVFVTAMAILNPLTGCIVPDQAAQACPTEGTSDAQCAWEGPVTYDLDELFQADGFVFVRAKMRWEPCGSIAGEQTRTYRIDPATAATSRIELLPSNAVTITDITSDPIELPIKDTNIRLRLLRSIEGSVTSPTLKIGDTVDMTTGTDIAPIEIDVVCIE